MLALYPSLIAASCTQPRHSRLFSRYLSRIFLSCILLALDPKRYPPLPKVMSWSARLTPVSVARIDRPKKQIRRRNVRQRRVLQEPVASHERRERDLFWREELVSRREREVSWREELVSRREAEMARSESQITNERSYTYRSHTMQRALDRDAKKSNQKLLNARASHIAPRKAENVHFPAVVAVPRPRPRPPRNFEEMATWQAADIARQAVERRFQARMEAAVPLQKKKAVAI